MSQLVLSTVSHSLVLSPEEGPVLELTIAALPQLVMHPSGMQGPPGPQGIGVQDDPGDFTLLFDNQLI